MMPATLALIGLSFHEERERNIAIAIWGSVAIVGAALGPIIGGWLLQHFWWGSVFLINVPVVVVAFVATLLLAPEGRRDTSRPWDLVSSLLALAALSGLVLAIKSLIATPPSYALGAGALLLAVISGAAFARRQQQLPYPLLDFAIFRNPAFWLARCRRCSPCSRWPACSWSPPSASSWWQALRRCRRACWCRWRRWAACPVRCWAAASCTGWACAR